MFESLVLVEFFLDLGIEVGEERVIAPRFSVDICVGGGVTHVVEVDVGFGDLEEGVAEEVGAEGVGVDDVVVIGD